LFNIVSYYFDKQNQTKSNNLNIKQYWLVLQLLLQYAQYNNTKQYQTIYNNTKNNFAYCLVLFVVLFREDIAKLANILAWDAVGAQIEPYLVQHAEWQRPCGVALGCRSLNSRGIKIGEQPFFLKMMTILDSKVGSAYFGILVHMLIVIAYNSINCILLHICTYSHISQFRSQYLIFFNPTSWTTKTLPRSLRTTIGFHQPPQASSHRTHHQSLQPLPAC